MFSVYVPDTAPQQPALYYQATVMRRTVQETGYCAVSSPKLREIQARFANQGRLRTR